MAVDGPVSTVVDLYRLTPETAAAAGVTPGVAKRILESIQASRTCPLADLIGNIGIPGFQSALAERLIRAKDCHSLDDLLALSEEDAADVLGEVRGPRFHQSAKLRCVEIRELAKELDIVLPAVGTGSPWAGKSFTITGDASIPRPQIIKIIKEAGGIILR